MSGKNIDHLFQLWAATTGDNPPFSDKEDLYTTIDATTAGNVPPWQCFSISMDVDGDDDTVPSWKTAEYDVYFRDPKVMLESQLANPDFRNEMDLSPKRVFDKDNKRNFKDFMSGNWAWRQAVQLRFLSSISQANCTIGFTCTGPD